MRMIVDDDPMLLRSVQDVLEADGHAVIAAAGGSAHTPVIRLTGWGAGHFDHVLGKPPKLRELRQALIRAASGEMRRASLRT